ncbi:SUMF1/EgtB/PvdO family nonheme iron enzyme [Zoogloea sp.]|uniref:SUMF1/EgtB/PvdO family nonheme iron enzyme n=1 Tax=Zoogloea sp. TaxID=49181 RepID=UPI0025DF2820|nr:SUMF1/EgtB/PvdO family nonheme iron enzyme [Zoogloea sp.]MCK6396244.1 SUMF1/EgtB/PvdO family nonheme iron enzyme [Zoogloea sp.]
MSPRKLRKQVYVSSTFSDLEQHRAHLKLALEKAGYDVECMERYSAFDTRPADKCLADVAACDVYVVLVALRYGHIPADDNPAGKSITEMEYDKAVETTRPKLAFVLDIDDEDFGWPLKRCDKDCQDANSNIARFRERVGNELGRALFTTQESLATAVLQALRQQEITEMPAGERDQAQIREAYLDWLRRECDSVELLGLDLKESRNVGLGHVYVPAVTNADVKGNRKGINLDKGPFLLLDNLGRSPLYVPGAAGSGKSTFCRWLALVVAEGRVPVHRQIAVDEEKFAETLPDALAGRLPLLVRLRDWASHGEFLAGRGRWTRAQLEASFAGWLDKTRPGELTGETFRAELKAGRCLLILDGVDEVPESRGDDLPRRNLLTGLADALPAWRKAGNWLLLTSRPYGLEAEDQRRLGLPIAELADLPYPLLRLFVRRWFDAADPANAEAKSDGLLTHLAQRDDLAEMRANPMLLTALCVKYDEGRRLPQDFYALYDAVVRQVLYKRCDTESERDQARNRLAAIALGMHRGESATPRQTPEAEVTVEEVDRILATLAEVDWVSESGAADAGAKRELLLSDSGLLLPRDNRRAAFYHLSFQEFLAAERIRTLCELPESILARYAGTPAWRRTLRFLFCAIVERDKAERAVTAWQSLLPALEPVALEANPAPALVLADSLEIIHAKGWSLNEVSKAPLLRACDHALHHLPPDIRAQLWLTRGRLGLDDRPGVGLRSDGLPDIAWEACEAGDFLYGSAKEKRTLTTPFHIARYPVTHRQFQAFIDAGGYGQDEWWAGLAERPEVTPAGWSESNAPRESVSWYEATAFCRWLDAQLRAAGLLPAGWRVRLPTEERWERAARGTYGREYPWEGDFRSGLANIDETRGDVGPCNLGRTSPVGLYPEGKAPSDTLDMAGNVWEWCSDEFAKPEMFGHVGERPRVLCGGSCFDGMHGCGAAQRGGAAPDLRSRILGFRVCCAAPID